METNPENTGEFKQGRSKAMSDVLTANYLIESIGGPGRVNEKLFRAYRTLTKLFPHADEPQKQWNERRLRSWWNRESDVVRHWQMLELYEAAQKVKAERELVAKARREHAEFIQKTARLAAFLEHQDEAFAGPQVEALRGMGCGVRGAGTKGE